MHSVLEILRSDVEEMPDFLQSFDSYLDEITLSSFFASRVVYYPGSGYDGRAFATFSAAHSAHCFVHVDLSLSATEIRDKLQPGHPDRLRGYRPNHEVFLPPGEASHMMDFHHRHPFPKVEPGLRSVYWTILERESEFDDGHGPRRLAFLHIQAEAIWFCWNIWGRFDQMPFGVVLQDHGTGMNWAVFGGESPLFQVGRGSKLPKYLLVAANTEPWPNYEAISKGSKTGFGECGHPVSLFRRNGPQQNSSD